MNRVERDEALVLDLLRAARPCWCRACNCYEYVRGIAEDFVAGLEADAEQTPRDFTDAELERITGLRVLVDQTRQVTA